MNNGDSSDDEYICADDWFDGLMKIQRAADSLSKCMGEFGFENAAACLECFENLDVALLEHKQDTCKHSWNGREEFPFCESCGIMMNERTPLKMPKKRPVLLIRVKW